MADEKEIANGIKAVVGIIFNGVNNEGQWVYSYGINESKLRYKEISEISKGLGFESVQEFVREYSDEFGLFGVTAIGKNSLYYLDNYIPSYW